MPTRKQLARKRCDVILLTHKGVTKPLIEWAEDLEIKYKTLPRHFRVDIIEEEGMSHYVKRLNSGRVELRSGDTTMQFDPRFGGGCMSFKYKGIELIETFGGSAVQATWQLEQDPTQMSPSGPCTNPIAQLNGVNKGYNYYGREITLNTVNNWYDIQAYCPYFWLSFEGEDDSIPDESFPQFCTKYNNFLNYPNSLWESYGTPVFFQGSPNKPAGTFWVGNDRVAASSTKWSNRLAHIANGNVAIKTRISLKQASNDAIAGLMFRKDVPVGCDEPQAYYGPGYHFLINKQGYWGLHELPSDNVVASGRIGWWSRLNLNRDGCVLEVRTHTILEEVLQLFCDGNLLVDFKCNPNLLGAAAGLFASCSNGVISFGERAVFDLNYFLIMSVAAYEDKITLSWEMKMSPGVSAPLPMYRNNMGIFFFADRSAHDAYLTYNGAEHHETAIVNIKPGDELCMVSPNEHYKVVITPTEIIKDSVPATDAHCLIGYTWKPNQPVISCNVLPASANQSPVLCSQGKIKYDIRVMGF